MSTQDTRRLYAICAKTRREFSIRVERKPEGWMMLYAVEDVDSPARSGDDAPEWDFEEPITQGSEYACPFCGNTGLVYCQACGCVTCHDGSGRFQCGSCGVSGRVE